MHDKKVFGERLKRAREALKYTQSGFADVVGSKYRSWQDYEKGLKTPGSQVITGVGAAGVNLNWLFNGEGPMLLAELQPEAPTEWNPELMRRVIEAIELALDLTGREMDPPDKAELVLLVYNLYAESGASPSTATIIKLVKTKA